MISVESRDTPLHRWLKHNFNSGKSSTFLAFYRKVGMLSNFIAE